MLLLSVAFMEGFIRATGIFNTYTETNFNYFLDPFERTYPSHHWVWGPNETFPVNNVEFNYAYSTNATGLIDREYTPGRISKVDRGVGRLICDGFRRRSGQQYAQEFGTPADGGRISDKDP